MSRLAISLSLFILGPLLFACGDTSESSSHCPQDLTTTETREKLKLEKNELAWLEDLLEHDEACLLLTNEKERRNCFSELDLRFSEGEFGMKDSNNEAILVVESSIDPLTVLRFRNRFGESFEFNGGSLIKNDPTLTLPAGLIELMKFFNRESFESSKQTQAIAKRVRKIYSWADKDRKGHNAPILGSLVEHNPQNPILTLGGMFESEIFGKKLLCGLPNTQNQFHQRTLVHKETLRSIIRDYHVRYINLSGGATRQSIRIDYLKTCGSVVSSRNLDFIEEEMAQMYEAFGSESDTILVQASAYPGNVGKIDRDKTRYPHRIRVGMFNANETSLNEDGVDTSRQDFETSLAKYDGAGVDADVFVNLAVDFYLKFGPATFLAPAWGGFGLWQISNIPQTSDATPLALTQIIYIRETFFRDVEFSDKFIEAIKERLTPQKCPYLNAKDGRCVFQDPLKHKQAMVFKLGYR